MPIKNTTKLPSKLAVTRFLLIMATYPLKNSIPCSSLE
jgi:hypothetical protein